MSLMLVLHVAAAFVGLVAGATALAVRKAGRPHRRSGIVFSVAIMLTTAAGAYLAALQPARLSILSAALTFYLVATGWATVRRSAGSVGTFEAGALFAGIAIASAGSIFASQAAHNANGRLDGIPPVGYLIFGSVAALAVIADLRMILDRGVAGARRLARHLWRMCAAFWIASASFFLGQQKVMPASLHGSAILYVPEIVILGLMIFWLIRVRRWKPSERRLSIAAG